jgi:hypothetical protein
MMLIRWLAARRAATLPAGKIEALERLKKAA